MKREKRFTRRLAAAGGALIAVALVVAGGGCELEVGDTLPNATCVPGGQNPCQSGFVCATNHQCVVASAAACRPACGGATRCNPTTLECVSVLDASVGGHGPDASSRSDAGGDARGDSMDDAGVAETAMGDAANGETQPPMDSQVACRDLACTCSGPSSCDSGICGNEDAVTTAVVKANGGNSFCTQPCCTSADCSASTVCFAAGTGGNYCVPPAWIGRVAGLGPGIGGATCKVASDCRSGLCTTSGTCADPCCSNPHAVAGDAGSTDKVSQCATGAICRFSTFPGNTNDTHYAAWCSPPGAGMLAPGSPCAIDGVCASDRCGFSFGCEAICRSTNDCANGFACSYSASPFTNTKDIAAGCMPAMGTFAEGSSCKNNGDCETNFCDSGKCSDVCFSDSDCIKGWHCRPVKISLSNGGYEDILSCGS